jgi:hypothetical protein
MKTQSRMGPLNSMGLLTGALVSIAACSSERPARMTQPPPELGPSTGVGGSESGFGGFPEKGMDNRSVVTAEQPPPPVSGGTLLALREGGVVAADADRGFITFVDVAQTRIQGVVDLGAGSEPGRLVEGDGVVYVILRGTGEVASVDASEHAVLERREVCRAPRGIVFDEERDVLVVSCLEGVLVELPASGGEALRTVESEADLRDLVLVDGRLFATRFRSAELLELDDALAVQARHALGSRGAFTPSVAWRAIASPGGVLFVSHQRGSTEPIQLRSTLAEPSAAGASAGVADSTGGAGFDGGMNGYGSSDPCAGIVEAAITSFSLQDAATSGPRLNSMTTSGRLAGSVLPVDIAVSSKGEVAVASAGPTDNAFRVSGSSLQLYTTVTLDHLKDGDCTAPDTFDSGPPIVAVAFDVATGVLVAQSREPPALHVYDVETFERVTLSLGGTSVFDTGHEIFHRDAGSGLACASCHPEGTDDSRVWNFATLGARRTQPLDVTIAGAPQLHWDGTFHGFHALVADVFVQRMGGQPQSADRAQALENYIHGLSPRPGMRPAGDAAALRGAELFASDRTGCSECHLGAAFTTHQLTDIGKGPPTKVPSLLGVSARAPFMHDGCATTLHDRFRVECGGPRHGAIDDLSATEIDDLVAYLETL